MKTKIMILLGFLVWSLPGLTQEYIPKLELSKKEKKHFAKGDSIIHLKIDTLILSDRSSLRFYNKKQVILEVGYAKIGEKVTLLAHDGQNNGSDIDIQINLQSLGDLYIDAGGMKATKGRNGLPHGNGGNVRFIYAKDGISPQTEDRKAVHFVRIHVQGGNNSGDSRSEVEMIQNQIRMGQGGLMGLPQGRLYSGTPGNNGTVELKSK